jgi:predicted RND superfamily exporter protein
MAAVSLPLWAGLSICAAVFKLSGVGLGLGNLCVFPLVVGICLDSTLYLAASSSHRGDRRKALLEAGRPITVSAISNAFCFGTLVFSSHPGLQELGSSTLIGVVICCATSLCLFPGPLTRPRP